MTVFTDSGAIPTALRPSRSGLVISRCRRRLIGSSKPVSTMIAPDGPVIAQTKKSSGWSTSCGSPPMKFSAERRAWCPYRMAKTSCTSSSILASNGVSDWQSYLGRPQVGRLAGVLTRAGPAVRRKPLLRQEAAFIVHLARAAHPIAEVNVTKTHLPRAGDVVEHHQGAE